MYFIYDNSKAKKTNEEILNIMRKRAMGKEFIYTIYNG